MTPPSLTVAREFLAAHVASGRERPDLEAAIRVVLDRVTACEALDQSIHGAASVITVSAAGEYIQPHPMLCRCPRCLAADAALKSDPPSRHEMCCGRAMVAHGGAHNGVITLVCSGCQSTRDIALVARPPKVTDLRLQEISESLSLDDEMRSMADELQALRAQPSRDRNEIAACSRAAGGDRGSDERLSEYITRLRRAVTEPKVAAPTAILIGALPGVRQIQSREDARELFGRRDGDAVWDAFGRAPAAACAEHACTRHPSCLAATVRCGCPECKQVLAVLSTEVPAEPDRRGPMSRAERAAALRADADRIERAEPLAATTHGTAIPPDATADDMLPCPFCCSTMLSVGKPPGGAFPILDRPYVSCTACGARGPLARSDANREAIANWNRRPQDRPHGERYLATAVRSLVVELGLTPSGTGSEDLGIIELEVKRLRAAAPLVDEQRVLAGGPAPGTFVRVTAGEHAGFRGTVQPKAADDPPGWCRVQRYLSTETRLFEAKSLDPIESFEERELGDASDAVRHAEIRALAAAAGLGEWWVQDMIDTGCTVEQARSHIWTGCGRR